jgi:hypothetical protein
MLKKVNPVVVIVFTILAVLVAIMVVMRTANAPGETINKYEDAAPKGAGKVDRATKTGGN